VTRLLLGPLLRHVGTRDATIWVETDQPCAVEILGHREHTWTVSGHHYALVTVDGLEPGSATAYEVRLDGELVWPTPDDPRPRPHIRTYEPGASVQIAFGSCRYARTDAVERDDRFDSDALDCYARRVAELSREEWPEALILLGDQVYADETSPETRKRIAHRRDVRSGPGAQVADFEEYTWLYHESWTDPAVRWLLSTVPTSMIFDDHDVHDDWNTSKGWRADYRAIPWWRERIIGALTSYWVYQHLGNLSPAELAGDELYQRVRAHDGDACDLLREFAIEADAEADGQKGARWSFRRDFGDVRLIVIDSRCGRMLEDDSRSMVSDAEFEWIERQAHGEYRHLLIGTSLPWLLPRALHDIESWNEELCAGTRGPRIARWSEKLRRNADLEHWASFRRSFDRLARLIADVGSGDYAANGADPPASVCVLSGDVHHAYAARVRFPDRDCHASVFQLTCSPLHNYVPRVMKVAFRVSWSRVAERTVRVLLGALAQVPPMIVEWDREAGPYFGNELMTLEFHGRSADVLLEKAGPRDDPTLRDIATLSLA
jgi:PhoD-like phosphatase